MNSTSRVAAPAAGFTGTSKRDARRWLVRAPWRGPGATRGFFAVAVLLLSANVIAAPIDEVYAANDRGDYVEEVRLLQPLVEQGLPAAQSMLGYLYSVGHGVPQDFSKAVAYLTQAANGGYVDAMTYLAWMYESGSGVPANAQAALEWHRKAGCAPELQSLIEKAENGTARDKWKLGRDFLRGSGCVPVDHAKGLRYVVQSHMDASDDTGYESAFDETTLQLPKVSRKDATVAMREKPDKSAPLSPISKDVKKNTRMWILSRSNGWAEVAVPDLGAGFIAWIPEAALVEVARH